jgi:ATP phosphoribosyltransferase
MTSEQNRLEGHGQAQKQRIEDGQKGKHHPAAAKASSPSFLRVAMPKGRIFEEAVQLFREAGYDLPPEFEDTRKLILEVPQAGMSFILAKPADVPTYVEYGVADIGVAGKDVLLEEEREVHELLDLNISHCHLAVAALPDWKPTLYPRVASKYPSVTSTYFREQGQQVEVIKLNGSVELAPLVGLAAMASGLDLAYRNAMKTLDGKSVSRVLVSTPWSACSICCDAARATCAA